MSEAAFAAGDVVWAPDPYRSAEQPRPWLILAADGLPYAGEEYVCAGLTLSALPDNLEVTTEDWVAGEPSGQSPSYCSPWVLATVKHDAVVNPQGAVRTAFLKRVVRRSVDYLEAALA